MRFGMGFGVNRGGAAGGAAPFDPASLFASGEEGYILDPSDSANLAQNSAGSTPVTALTQPVGRVVDISGNGNHFTQTTDAHRPTWREDANGFKCLDGNGVSQRLITPSNVATGAGKKATLWLAFRRDSADFTYWILSHLTGNAGGLAVYVGSGTYQLNIKLDNGTKYRNTLVTGSAVIVSVQFDNTTTTHADVMKLRLNGESLPLTALGGNGLGDWTAAPHAILGETGASASLDGGVYGAVLRYAESTTEEIEAVESWLAERCGVTL